VEEVLVMQFSLFRYGMGACAASCAFVAVASANTLTYDIIPSQSDVAISTTVQGAIDVNPDLTELLPGGDDFPMFASMAGGSTTSPTTDSTVMADVGIPGGFDNGTHGITFSQLSIVLPDLPGPLEGFGIVPIPLDLTGSNNQLAAFLVHITSFQMDLAAAFHTTLNPTGNPNEWSWASLATMTIHGTLQPLVQIPTQGDIPGGQVPFSQQVIVPLVGTFSGDQTKTRITVGIEQHTLQNQDLNVTPDTLQVDVGNLGIVTGLFSFKDFNLVDISTAAVYVNPTPIPEPNTALLLGLGLVAFGCRRRR